MLLKILILSYLSMSWSSVSATSVLRDTILVPGDKAPFYGVLISEIRYRQFTDYQTETDQLRFMLEELDKQNLELEKELDQRPNVWVYFLLGALITSITYQ